MYFCILTRKCWTCNSLSIIGNHLSPNQANYAHATRVTGSWHRDSVINGSSCSLLCENILGQFLSAHVINKELPLMLCHMSVKVYQITGNLTDSSIVYSGYQHRHQSFAWQACCEGRYPIKGQWCGKRSDVMTSPYMIPKSCSVVWDKAEYLVGSQFVYEYICLQMHFKMPSCSDLSVLIIQYVEVNFYPCFIFCSRMMTIKTGRACAAGWCGVCMRTSTMMTTTNSPSPLVGVSVARPP